MPTAAVLVERGYPELEFWFPVLRLREHGYEVTVVAPEAGETYRSTLGYPVISEAAVKTCAVDVVVVPGGAAARRLADNPEVLDLVSNQKRAGRVAVIGAGSSVVDAAGVSGEDQRVLRFEDADSVTGLIPALDGAASTHTTADALRVVVLAESQYQELELWYPVLRLREAGADVLVAAPQAGALYASKLGVPVYSDVAVDDIAPDEVDAIVVPGGFAPEAMRRSAVLLSLVRGVHDSGGIVAAICHAGWVLVSSGIAPGRKLTCVPIIRDDVMSAGADYVDEPVVRDGNLITSRLPNDLPDFCAELIRALKEAHGPRGRGAGWPSNVTLRSTAAFDRGAALVQAPAGPGSANYRTTSVLADTIH